MEDGIDFDIMASAINTIGADIVGLNEMYSEGELPQFKNQVGILSEMTGLRHYYFAKAIDVDEGNNPYGNGLLSRYPIVSAETVMVPDPDGKKGAYGYETRCLLKARLENGLNVLVIHFGLNHDEQINAVKTVIENLPTEKTILMGDFNVTPDDEVLAPIRERLRDTADLFTEEKLSYPSDEPDKKIDYIFVTPDIQVEMADIPSIVASDHRPHIAEIVW
jgi:endonuclease/exonuclease/phosphatase family metal-dependent hydrolase